MNELEIITKKVSKKVQNPVGAEYVDTMLRTKLYVIDKNGKINFIKSCFLPDDARFAADMIKIAIQNEIEVVDINLYL